MSTTPGRVPPPTPAIRIENLGRPIQQLLKARKKCSDEELKLLGQISVKDVAAVFNMQAQGLGTNKIWDDLQAKLRKRRVEEEAQAEARFKSEALEMAKAQAIEEDKAMVKSRDHERSRVQEEGKTALEGTCEDDVVSRLRAAKVEKQCAQIEDEAHVKATEVLQAEEKARAKIVVEAKAKGEEEERMQAEEARIQREVELRLKAIEDARAKVEAELRAKALVESEAKAKVEAEIKCKELNAKEAKQRVKKEAKLKAKEEARVKARKEAERMMEEQAKEKAREEAKQKGKEDAEQKAKEEAEQKAKAETEQKAKEEAEQKAKEEDRNKKLEETKAKIEEEARLKIEKETKAMEARIRAEVELRIKMEVEAQFKAAEEARLKAKQDAKTKAETEAKAKAKEEEELLVKAKAETEAEDVPKIAATQVGARAKAVQQVYNNANANVKDKGEGETDPLVLENALAEIEAWDLTQERDVEANHTAHATEVVNNLAAATDEPKAKADEGIATDEEALAVALAEVEAWALAKEREEKLVAEAEAAAKAAEVANVLTDIEAWAQAQEHAAAKAAEEEAKAKANEVARALAEVEAWVQENEENERAKSTEEARAKLVDNMSKLVTEGTSVEPVHLPIAIRDFMNIRGPGRATSNPHIAKFPTPLTATSSFEHIPLFNASVQKTKGDGLDSPPALQERLTFSALKKLDNPSVSDADLEKSSSNRERPSLRLASFSGIGTPGPDRRNLDSSGNLNSDEVASVRSFRSLRSSSSMFSRFSSHRSAHMVFKGMSGIAMSTGLTQQAEALEASIPITASQASLGSDTGNLSFNSHDDFDAEVPEPSSPIRGAVPENV